MNRHSYGKTGYGNAEERPERSCGFCTGTGGDFSLLALPVLGKTNALNFGVWTEPNYAVFLIMHDFQMANNDVFVVAEYSPLCHYIIFFKQCEKYVFFVFAFSSI